MEEKLLVYIGCPRFGGRRNALACAHYDRFRGCRRYCKSLEAAMKENPNFREDVKELYKDRDNLMPSRRSCVGLPLEEEKPYTCKICSFVAKSERGLKSHITRSHT